MWAAQAAKLGYKWKTGNGKKKLNSGKIIGLDLLVWRSRSGISISWSMRNLIFDLWDGSDLKCTFRRCADGRLMNIWQEIIQLASTILSSLTKRTL